MTYDCFCILNELDLLEIRLNILDLYVDRFVICESPHTFSGLKKPLYYLENHERFKKWEDKIIYHNSGRFEVTDKTPTSFDLAAFQKDSIREVLKDCEPEDIIYYGDIDEIWKPQIEEGKLRQLCYSYYLNNRSSENWQGTNMVRYKNIKNLNDLRADHSRILEDGGWHLTNMGGYEQVLFKLQSYDHQEANTPEVRKGLLNRMKGNVDYLGRANDWQGNPFRFWVDESELPQYLLDNKDKWIHLWKL